MWSRAQRAGRSVPRRVPVGVHRLAGVCVAGLSRRETRSSPFAPACTRRAIRSSTTPYSAGQARAAFLLPGIGHNTSMATGGRPAEHVVVEHRKRRVENRNGRLDLVAEDRPPDHPQGQADHFRVRIDACTGACRSFPLPRDCRGLLGRQVRVAHDLLAGEQRLDQPPLTLPALPFGMSSPPRALRRSARGTGCASCGRPACRPALDGHRRGGTRNKAGRAALAARRLGGPRRLARASRARTSRPDCGAGPAPSDHRMSPRPRQYSLACSPRCRW